MVSGTRSLQRFSILQGLGAGQTLSLKHLPGARAEALASQATYQWSLALDGKAPPVPRTEKCRQPKETGPLPKGDPCLNEH